MADVISLLTYNLHGFNQGEPLLNDLCNCDNPIYDFICVQEHWLTPANMYKIHNLSRNYSFMGSSAMGDEVSSGILVGRPFGGVGILIKTDIVKNINMHIEREYFELIVAGRLVVISLYLPCVKNDNDCNKIDNIIDDISCIRSIFSNSYVV